MPKATTSFYKYCIVPLCKNTTFKTPEKTFFLVPKDSLIRKRWCSVMKRDTAKGKKLSFKSSLYCCADHFSLENDMENYMAWKMMGGHIRLKKGVLPHKFDCQRKALNLPDRSAAAKKRLVGQLPSCAAVGCTNGPGKNSQGVSFHKFPKDGELRAAWVKACGRPKWKPTARSSLCSNHFSEDQIDRTSPSAVRLRDNAVPNVFTGASSQKKAAHAAATTSSETSEPNFEPEIVIKEEPIDIDEEQLPSTSRTGDEFILPWTPADTPSTSQQTPTLGVAFTVIKKEVTDDQEDAAKKTSNGKPNKASKKKADKGEVEQSEKKLRESEEDSAKDRPKDHFDAYGEYIAAKLRKLDWKSCAYVQKAIGDIIFEAEMGKYKQ